MCFQAAHWFDLNPFYSEVDRTLKPMGVLAVYGYGLVAATGENSRALNQVIQDVTFFFPDSNLSACLDLVLQKNASIFPSRSSTNRQ